MLMRTEISVTPASSGVEIAAAVLEHLKDERNWTQGHLQVGRKHCLMGSALRVTGLLEGGQREGFHSETVAKKLAAALGFENPSQAVMWNDCPWRTHEDVLDRLKGAL
jgi:BRCT domain type II-containing protein